MENSVTTVVSIATPEKEVLRDFSPVFSDLRPQYLSHEPYFNVEAPVPYPISSWIFHISVIRQQFLQIARNVVEFCVEHGLSFRIPKDHYFLTRLLDGSFGEAKLGKVFVIYPRIDSDLVILAKELIQITIGIRCPKVPTDYYLDAGIFTRYVGPENTDINLLKGYTVPFQLQQGVGWPFGEITNYQTKTPPKILHGRYIPSEILKDDLKGPVFKAIWWKKPVFLKWCIVKGGKANMWMDDAGRSIKERLLWQAYLGKKLPSIIQAPKIFDAFEIEGDFFLVTEYIKGESLDEVLTDIYKGVLWRAIGTEKKKKVLSLLSKVIDLVGLIHRAGYVHRDVTPANFLVTKKGTVHPIDLELMYSTEMSASNPPFRLGTPGYVSPEQQRADTPTVKEDIYAIGCLLLACLVRLAPHRIERLDLHAAAKNIAYFIPERPLQRVILSCLAEGPSERPEIQDISNALSIIDQESNSLVRPAVQLSKISPDQLNDIIISAIEGLADPIFLNEQGIWFSDSIKEVANTPDLSKISAPGLMGGASGILYTIANARLAGFDTAPVLDAEMEGWSFVGKFLADPMKGQNWGLFDGKAGIALALEQLSRSGIEVSLGQSFTIPKEIQFDKSDISLSGGIAGVILGMLRGFINPHPAGETADNLIAYLITAQQKNGSWIAAGKKPKDEENVFLRQGTAGVVYALMEYYSRINNQDVLSAIERGLNFCENAVTGRQLKEYNEGSPIFLDGAAGIANIFLKASIVSKNKEYLSRAENILQLYPKDCANAGLSYANGLSGLGIVYLNAYKITQNDEWLHRARNIAESICHSSLKTPSEYTYWIATNSTRPNASFDNGSSGIINFLVESSSPDSPITSIL